MVKPRENRVPIMLSESELAAIDDWRFKNRVATRSDAIRRLCQMALILDEKLTPIANAVNQFSSEYADTTEILFKSFINNDMSPTTLKEIELHLALSASKFTQLKYTVRELTGRAYDFKQDIPFEEAANASAANKELFDGIILRLAEINQKSNDLKKPNAKDED